MPTVRLCPYCRKGFLKSTYQMFEHVKKCDKYKIITETLDKNQPATNNIQQSINNKLQYS